MRTQSSTFHLIFGTGPAACWTAVALRARGIRVKAVNRSGLRPALMPADVPILRVEVSDRAQAVSAAQGAAVVYQALSPAYSQWAALFPALQAHTAAAAQQAGARYVALENLYMLDAGTTMTETSRVAPRSVKGHLRQRMHDDLMALHACGDLQVAVVRAASFYGPGVTLSTMGQRVFGPLAGGGKPQVMMRADLPHSHAYIEDVGRALAAVGTGDAASRLGRIWLAPHAPAVTQGEMMDSACRLLGRPAQLSVVAPWMLRMVSLFNAEARASIEMAYQLQAPFVVDASRSEEALGLAATPLQEGLRRTLAWYGAPMPDTASADLIPTEAAGGTGRVRMEAP